MSPTAPRPQVTAQEAEAMARRDRESAAALAEFVDAALGHRETVDERIRDRLTAAALREALAERGPDGPTPA